MLNSKSCRFAAIAFIILVSLEGHTVGNTMTISPSNTLHSAISSALPGDTLLVESGIYRESLNVTKPLTLRGQEAGGMKPVIDAGGEGSAITLSADGIILEGFTATGSAEGAAGINVTSSNNLIQDNNVLNNCNGISLWGTGNTVSGNIARNNRIGIALYASRNTIKDNSVSRNELCGVYLDNADDNLLENNTASENRDGIALHNSSSNRIIRNHLLQNTEHNAFDDGINEWDDGTAGNYYDDCDCTDSEGDGICDAAHRIPGGYNIDNYPLASKEQNAPEKSKSEMAYNLPPTAVSLTPDLHSPQEVGATVNWRATTEDPENDLILYRFMLSGPRNNGSQDVVQNWSTSNLWSWCVEERDVGSSMVSVHIRDGKHAGPLDMDDFKESSEYIIKAKQLASLNVEVINDVYSEKDRRMYYCIEGKNIYYKNRVYLTGQDLDKVVSVTYVLHPSFENPVQVSKDAANNFEIWLWTWGRFPITAIIATKSSQEFNKTYQFSFKSKVEDAKRKGIPQIYRCEE